MIVEVPVSIGELYDKISILEIKRDRAQVPEQLENINNELERLYNRSTKLDLPDFYKTQLYSVNSRLWDVEDEIRKKENAKEFDDEFILLARMVYMYNDTRAEIKRNINRHTNSSIVEEKIY